MLRSHFLQQIRRAFAAHPVVALLGPRQSGKTTLARQLASEERRKKREVIFFDLEDATDLSRFEHPQATLSPLEGLVVIDEVQHAPELFKTLRVLVDRPPSQAKRAHFLVLGSASWNLLRQGSETLAGRIQFLELTPFSLREVGIDQERTLWLRGGFPRSYLARGTHESVSWRKAFIKTYLERDIPSLGLRIPPASLRRFWMMLAHYHGQIFNASEISRSLGVTDHTVRHYLDVLAGTFMVRHLSPWVENISKRQVRSPKIYFRDSGIFHTLLGLASFDDLAHHPKLGASWEGFALEEIIRSHQAESEETYFWSTHSEAELDLLILQDGKRLGYEVKYTDTPRATRSMRIALQDLKLDQLRIVFPGKKRFALDPQVEAAGLSALIDLR